MNYNSESCELTLNTTRICTTDAIDTSIEVSKIGFTNMKPNAVILINEKEVFDGIAATPLVHFPINASLLFTDGNSLSKKTLHEIKRLSPKGYNGIHVILVGKISKKVSCELNYYGFRTHHIAGTNHYETACMVPKVRKEFKNIIIMSGEDYSEGIVSGYWSAHHGDPILFVKKNKIPDCTIEEIKKMKDINIYIVGSTKTVSKEVEDNLCNLDNVKYLGRIDGENPYEIAVNFAKYKDHESEFGWGRIYREGHAFTFGELKNPMNIIAGVLFAHMGKHTPSLIIKKDRTPEVVEKYIKSVKPMPPKGMPKPPFMHGFILGSTQDISHYAQMMIEDNLSIDHEMMGMEHDMGESLCMNDSDCMSTHQIHHPDYMMEMEHDMSKSDCMKDSDCMEMHQMHHPGHMMEMKHEMSESDCMKDSDCMEMHQMHHPDHIMKMKHDMDESDCMKDLDCMGMHQMHHPYHMMKMKHDMGESDCMKDSDCMSMHQMHHPCHMMKMKQDIGESDCIKGSGCMKMHHPDHMMEMKHEMSKSGCMKDSDCMEMHQMHHPDYMMEMKHVMGESDCMKDSDCMEMHQMHHPCHMMKIKQDIGESDCIKGSGCMKMHHPDHMMEMKHEMSESGCMKDSDCMSMHQMYHPDHMMEMKHEMSESDCIKGSGCMKMHQMHCPYHTMDMDNEEDKNNDEMILNYDVEMKNIHKSKHSGSNFIIVSIDDMLS